MLPAHIVMAGLLAVDTLSINIINLIHAIYSYTETNLLMTVNYFRIWLFIIINLYLVLNGYQQIYSFLTSGNIVP